jgi:hypothetical protein
LSVPLLVGFFKNKGKTMNELLKVVAEKVTSNWSLCNSKWQNCECEVIVAQTIQASAANLENHGDAFSWLNENANRGRQVCGTDNASALQRLIKDGSLVVGDYTGTAVAPDETVHKKGKPQVVRVTESLLRYVASHAKIKVPA